MKKMLLLLIPLLLIGCAATGPQVNFAKPDKLITNADLDYAFIQRIDQVSPPYPANSRYQIGDLPTVKGKFTVLKYVIEYQGGSAEKGQTKFHDLLVVKVDQSTNKIIDAYKYTLEWADTPSLALYKLGKKGLTLRPDLKLSDLGLTKVSAAPEK